MRGQKMNKDIFKRMNRIFVTIYIIICWCRRDTIKCSYPTASGLFKIYDVFHVAIETNPRTATSSTGTQTKRVEL